MAQPCQRVEQLDLLEHQRTEHARRLVTLERKAESARIRDTNHATRLAALEKVVERGFSGVQRDLREMRKQLTRLVWLVGILYGILRWGPGAVDELKQAFAAPPVPPAAAAPAHPVRSR